MKSERLKVKSAVYLLLEKDDRYLLMRRFNAHYRNGYYTPIAGHIDPGEGATMAMVREAKEEAGIIVDPADLSVVYTCHRREGPDEYIEMYFATKKWQGEPTNMEPEKCDDMRWFPKNDLPEKEYPYVVAAREAIARGEHFGEYVVID